MAAIAEKRRFRATGSDARLAFLILVAACLFFACASQTKVGAGEMAQTALIELRGAALVEIQDPMRARHVVTLLEQLRCEDREARDAVAGYRQRLRAIDANYDSTEEDLSKLFAEFNHDRLDRQRRIVDFWTQMAALMGDSEWDALKDKRVAAVKALVTAG